MTPFEDLIGKTGESVEPLLEAERSRMRALLSEYAAFKPARNTARASRAGVFSFILMRPALAAVLIFVLFVTSSGAVAYAAEGTVPGDLLYPVKVSITEPVVTALTPSGQAQATWQLTIAKRRLDEAAALAAKGRLASSTEAALVSRAADATLKGAIDAAVLPQTTASSTDLATASTTASLIRASQFLLEGRARLEAHDDTGAAHAFTAAIHAAATTPDLAHAAANIDLRVLDAAASSTASDEDASSTPSDVHTNDDDTASTSSTTTSTVLDYRLHHDQSYGDELNLNASTTLKLFDHE